MRVKSNKYAKLHYYCEPEEVELASRAIPSRQFLLLLEERLAVKKSSEQSSSSHIACCIQHAPVRAPLVYVQCCKLIHFSAADEAAHVLCGHAPREAGCHKGAAVAEAGQPLAGRHDHHHQPGIHWCACPQEREDYWSQLRAKEEKSCAKGTALNRVT